MYDNNVNRTSWFRAFATSCGAARIIALTVLLLGCVPTAAQAGHVLRACAAAEVDAQHHNAQLPKRISSKRSPWEFQVLPRPAADDCDDLVATGRAAYERRAYADAASAFDAAVVRCGPTEPLLLALAQSQLLAQHVPAALDTLERLLASNGRHVGALKVQARALYLAGRDPDAERALTTAAALAPTDDEIVYDLGRIYYQQKRYREAAAQFERAIALNPRSHKAYDNLGLTTEALGDVPQAMRHYLKAIELVHRDQPHYDVVYANVADLMLKLGEYRKAFDLASEAAQRNADDARNLFLTGKALVKLERFDVSVKWLERAVALDPSYPEPRYLLAQTYRRLGREADAARELEAFQEAQSRAPAVRR